MARDARIRYYGGASCQDADLLDTQTQVVDENKASIITNSYGDLGEDVPLDLVIASRTVFLQSGTAGDQLPVLLRRQR